MKHHPLRYIAATSAVTIAFYGAALLTTHAAGLAAGTTGNVGATYSYPGTAAPSGASVNVDIGTSASTGMSSSSSAGSVNAGIYSNSQTSASSSTGMQSDSASSDNVGASVQTTDTDSSGNLSIDADALRLAGAPDLTLTSDTQVTSSSDLDQYARSVAYSDPSVSAVSATDSTVAVTYARPARFLGIFPATLHETATVNANADGSSSVSVKKPWWSALSSSDAKSVDFQTSLQSRVDAIGAISPNGTINATSKARLITAIEGAEHDTYGASASASASPSVSGSASSY